MRVGVCMLRLRCDHGCTTVGIIGFGSCSSYAATRRGAGGGRRRARKKRSGRRRRGKRGAYLKQASHKDKVSCICTCLVSKSNIFHRSVFLLVFSSFLSMFYYRKIDKYATYFIQQSHDNFIFCYPKENVFFTSQSSHQKRENGDLAVTRSLIANSHTLQRLDTVKLELTTTKCCPRHSSHSQRRRWASASRC